KLQQQILHQQQNEQLNNSNSNNSTNNPSTLSSISIEFIGNRGRTSSINSNFSERVSFDGTKEKDSNLSYSSSFHKERDLNYVQSSILVKSNSKEFKNATDLPVLSLSSNNNNPINSSN